MTIVEHLKSDGDVLKLVVLTIGAVWICALVLWLIASKLSIWRRTPKRKPRALQRPFIASNNISPTPKDGSPIFTYSPLNQWSPNRWSPSPSPNNNKFPRSSSSSTSTVKAFTRTPSSSPNKSFTRITPSPVSPSSFNKKSFSRTTPRTLSPSSFTKKSLNKTTPNSISTSRFQSYSPQTEQQRTNNSPRLLSQVISCLNKSDSKRSTGHYPPSRTHRFSPDYTNPFVLDHSTTTEDSTLPSLLISSDTSNENIIENTDDEIEPKITMDKGVNTEYHLHDEIIDSNDFEDIKDKGSSDSMKSRIIRPRIQHLWSHKCPMPCVEELRTPCSPTWSNDSADMLPDLDPEGSESEEKIVKDPKSDRLSLHDKISGKQGTSSKKCGLDVFVQTEFTGDIDSRINLGQKDCKTSPLCSSDSTIKEIEHSKQCCCASQTHHKLKKQNKLPKRLKKSSLVRSLERKLPEELEILETEPSIKDRTSFIPPKTWYSLGSLCDDDDENCESCGRNWKDDAHRNYHQRMYDSDTKLNLSSADAVSYNDTGYTSTEEEDSSNNDSAGSKGASSRGQQSSPENNSYDGDYESDDDIFHCRLVGSDELVYKPQPSISEPFAIDTYAEKEWKGDTPTATAIKEGYAAIPRHVSCHQLRQIRGDNYCAIRATLFQALVKGIPLLDKLPQGGIPQVLRTIPTNVLQQWSFAGRIDVNKSDVISTLEEILSFYVNEVKRCLDISSVESKTDHLLSLFNDDAGNSEFKLLEAVKLIMMYQAVLLYHEINSGNAVPVLAYLLFARDTSCDPQTLLRNHLNSVGDTGGLEQVEMCLLGFALGVVVQVFRPSQVSKPDFIANYPYLEDMPPFSPTVSLVAEDDRHYNIVVE